MTDRYRLADTTLVEPLVHRWHPSPLVISPVTAALVLNNYQLPLLRAYVGEPAAHFDAARNPELKGGPFVDIPPARVAEVEALLHAAETRQRDQIALADAVFELERLLAAEANGQSLAAFYRRVPAPLRGYVELFYDYNDHPGTRFFEGLLYRSSHDRSDLQSLRLTRLPTDQARPFFMTTPRLVEPDDLDWTVPFDAASVDDLFRLDVDARPLDRIAELLQQHPDAVRPFVDHARAIEPAWTEAPVRVRYFGHACVLLESRGVSVLTDPFIGVTPTTGGPPRFSYGDLPARIDYAIITHLHFDHFHLETLLRLRHRIGHLVVPHASGLVSGDISPKLLAQRLGFAVVHEIDAMESLRFPGGELVGIPFLGEHGDLPHAKTAYVVRFGDQRILIAADSDCLDDAIYRNVRTALGQIETVFIGTESVGAPLFWTYGPLFRAKHDRRHEHSRRQKGSDAAAAFSILEALGANRIYNYAMGMEPWVEYMLGLGLTPDSEQVREGDALIERARMRGFAAAERLLFRRELVLEPAHGTASARREDPDFSF